jgi:protein-L-isoaspartate O-methyltransferase
MGLVYFGIPKEETIFIKNEMGLDVFVEGGAYLGNTAKEMSYIFRKVFTIEKSEIIFKKAEENLKILIT